VQALYDFKDYLTALDTEDYEATVSGNTFSMQREAFCTDYFPPSSCPLGFLHAALATSEKAILDV